LIVLDKVNAFVFIEEPEAHLFPNAQKEITDFIVFIKKTLKCKFFLTTHSPYLLATLNNDIYAFNVGAIKKNEVEKIINNSLWLEFKSISAFLVNNGSVVLLNDTELQLLKVEEIDQISSEINQDYEKIFSIDNFGDKNVCE
jgi:predicted ATP-dependent endonuclease of OLD family